MILQDLRMIADRKKQPPVGCWEQECAVDIFVDENGKLVDLIVHKIAKDSALPRRWFPFIEPENSGKPSVGVHTLQYLLGQKFDIKGMPKAWQIKSVQDDGCAGKADFLKRFASSFAKAVPESERDSAKAWSTFLQVLKPEDLIQMLEEKVSNLEKKALVAPGSYAAIFVCGRPWWQEDAVVEAWGKGGRAASDKKKMVGEEEKPACGQCSACGTPDVELERLIPSFDGLVLSKGGPKPVPRKLSYVSFNSAVYQSRGLTDSYNAPLCKSCADRSVKGWNALMSSDATRELLDDEVFGFWGEVVQKPSGPRITDPKPWKEMRASVRQGRPVTVAPEGIIVLGLGAHQATAYVTTWLKKDAKQASSALLRWWTWQDVAGEDQPEVYTISDLIMALRPRSKWYDRIHSGAGSTQFTSGERKRWRELLSVSYGEAKVSTGLLADLNLRFASEMETSTLAFKTPQERRKVGRGKETGLNCYPLDRLVLLNICLASLNDMDAIDTTALTLKQRNAFNSGQMFRVLCEAQRTAIGDTGDTVLTSSAQLASTKPALALPRLITRFNTVYRKKLLRDDKGLAIHYDRLIKRFYDGAILEKTLSVEQTGWFWKGFYTDLPKTAKQ